MKSLGAMIRQLTALLGTKDLSAWEVGFVENVAHQTDDGIHTTLLTEKQIVTVESIYAKHFGDAA